jgi:hypothetical protein
MAIAPLGDLEARQDLSMPWPRPELRLVVAPEPDGDPASDWTDTEWIGADWIGTDWTETDRTDTGWIDDLPAGPPPPAAGSPVTRDRTAPGHRGARHHRGVSRAVRRRRAVLATVVAGLVVALALPISALGGRPVAGAASTPSATVPGGHGAVYVVQAGDTLHTIAVRFGHGHPAALQRQLVQEAGSPVVVPGEHLRLP